MLKKLIGLSPWILIILLVILVVHLAIRPTGEKNRSAYQATEVNSVPTENISDSQALPTSTYVDQKFGFSFEVPQDWTNATSAVSGEGIIVCYRSPSKPFVFAVIDYENIPVSLEAWANAEDQTPAVGLNVKEVSRRKETVSDVPVIIVCYKGKDDTGNLAIIYNAFIKKKNNKAFTLTLYVVNDDDPSAEPYFNDIIRSFRFN